ncbi:MAG: hypothetical protein ACTSUE_04250 [Promethearchaeota archaeon]
MERESKKKISELPLSGILHAPSGRGSVDVKIDQCLSCYQGDPEKISVLHESREIIKHAMSLGDGDEGDVYEVQCDECKHTYSLGVLTIESKTPSGTSWMASVFAKDEKTNGKWVWLGYF